MLGGTVPIQKYSIRSSYFYPKSLPFNLFQYFFRKYSLCKFKFVRFESSDSESFLVVHTYFRPDGCQREGFWDVVGQVESPWDLSQTSSSNKWRLSSSVFLARRSCHKTTPANGYYSAWPGWVVTISALALTPWSLEPSLFSWRGKTQQAAEKS